MLFGLYNFWLSVSCGIKPQVGSRNEVWEGVSGELGALSPDMLIKSLGIDTVDEERGPGEMPGALHPVEA